MYEKLVEDYKNLSTKVNSFHYIVDSYLGIEQKIE